MYKIPPWSVNVTIYVKWSSIYPVSIKNISSVEWTPIYQERVRRNSSVDKLYFSQPNTPSWLFTSIAIYSNIMLQLSDIVNGIEKDEQIALLYVNHDVDVIRQMASAIVKYGPKGVNIRYDIEA